MKTNKPQAKPVDQAKAVEQQMRAGSYTFAACFGALIGGLVGDCFLSSVACAIGLPLVLVLLDIRNETVAVTRELAAALKNA